MGIGTLLAMLAASLAAIGLLSLQADYAVFMPGLLQGAWLTFRIAILGSVLAEVSAHLPPGLTFAHFRPEEAPVGPGDDPGRLLAIVKLARYLQKHFDSAGHTASGGPG